MNDSEKKDLLGVYQKKKSAGNLSANLANPSPGKLRDECLIVYKERYAPADDETLRLFFTKDNNGDYSDSIENLDIDKFRPLVGLLRGKVENPNEKHYGLLAWLMSSPHNGGPVEETKFEDKIETAKRTTSWKVIVSIMVILFAGGGSLLMFRPQGCMYWTGDHYQITPCDIKHGDTALIAFDEQQAAQKKILNPDTISDNAIGRVWYIKINHGLEYYTTEGFHPVDTRRKLKPITSYMIEKYIRSANPADTPILGQAPVK